METLDTETGTGWKRDDTMGILDDTKWNTNSVTQNGIRTDTKGIRTQVTQGTET